MKTSANGRKFITQWEGCKLNAYKDSVGVLTIGVGHTSAAGLPIVSQGMKITQAQADQILASDLAKVEAEVSNLVRVPLNQNQFDTLVSFHFNTGKLGKSTLLKRLNSGDYDSVPNELAKYVKAGGQYLQGLANRRSAEAKLWRTKTINLDAPVIIGAGGAAAAVAWPAYIPYVIGGVVLAAAIYVAYRIWRKK